MATIRAADGHRHGIEVLAGQDTRKARPLDHGKRKPRKRRFRFLRRGDFR